MKKHLLLLIMLCLTGVGSAWAQTQINTAVALKQLFTNGGEGILTADITINENLAISLTSKPITLDFNGCTINGGTNSRITVSDGVTLTFTDNIGGGGFASENMMPIYINGGNITINSGIFSTSYNTVASSLIHIPNTAVNPVVTINGGSFIAGYRVIRANVGTVNIYGGRFSGRINHTPSYGGNVNMYGGMKENLTETSNASSFNSISYNKIINGWKVYSVNELGDGDIDNNQLKGGTFTFDPSLPLYNIGGQSLVADGYEATYNSVTGRWVVSERGTKTYTINFVNKTGYGEQLEPLTNVTAIPDLSAEPYAYNDEEISIVWCTDEARENEAVSGAEISELVTEGNTLTLYAKKVGQLKEYTIHFVNTTGYGDTPDNIAGQTTIPDNLPDYAADDSHIVWYTNEVCTTPAVAGTRIREIVGLEVNAITLYAKWEEMATAITSESELQTLFANGGKGRLTRNITIPSNLSVSVGKPVVLDLGGNTLTQPNTFYIDNKDNLTIKNGIIVYDDVNYSNGLISSNGSNLTLDNVTVIYSSEYSYDNYNSLIKVNAGNSEFSNCTFGYDGNLIKVYNRYSVEITTSNPSATNTFTNCRMISYRAIGMNSTTSQVIINSGVYTGCGGPTGVGCAVYALNGGTLNIKDGTFVSKDNMTTAQNTGTIYINNTIANIYGGSFTSSMSNTTESKVYGTICSASSSTVNIYGGVFNNTSTGNNPKSLYRGGTVNLYGGYFMTYIHVGSDNFPDGASRNNFSGGTPSTTDKREPSIVGKEMEFDGGKITSGSFTFNPSLNIYDGIVADGYEATYNSVTGRWVVGEAPRDVIIDKDGKKVDPAEWNGSDNNFGIYEGGNTEIQDKVNVFHKTGENTYVCNKLTLTDGQDFELPDALDNKTLAAAKVTYTRNVTINTEKYTTVCLPYSFPTDGLKVMEFGSFENGVLTFSPVEETVPGKPYLIRVADNGTEMTSVNFSTSTETALSAAETEAQFVGTYNKVQLSSDVSTTYYGYSSANNEFRRIATSNCPAFRAYLQIATVAGARTAISINFGDDATGIENAIVETGDNAAPIYTLNGVRVEKPTKAGIYVQGGRKIIVNK